MTRIRRRDLFKAAAAGGIVLGGSSRASAAEDYRLFTRKNLPAPRPLGKVEVLFTCPGNSSNGLECSPEGVWTIDIAGSRTDTPGKCKVYLSSYEGKLLRELSPEGTGPSGIASDGKTLWIASTYSREIIRVDATSGETIAKYFTPGAGVIYRWTSDPAPRPDTYGRGVRAQTAAAAGGDPPAGGRGRGAGGRGGQAGAPAPGTGAHGLELKEGKLWMAVPPARMIYRIDPNTWTVEHMFPSVGYRPHGIGFEGNHLWESDTNYGAFFKRDAETGDVVDHVQIAEGDPFPHGMAVRDGYFYWCDDIGGGKAPLCRARIPGARGASSSRG